MDKTILKRNEESIFNKIKNFIGRDVKSKNESKKLIVVIRFLLILIMVYFSINGFIKMFYLIFLLMLFDKCIH